MEDFYEILLTKLRSCRLDDLLLLSWGSTDLPAAALCLQVQEAAATQILQQREEDREVQGWVRLAETILGIVWAWNFAGLLGDRLLAHSRRVICEGSVQLDQETGTSILRQRRASASEVFVKAALTDPAVILDMSDMLVIFKPPGWEVYNGMVECQLTDFLRSLNRGTVPILGDVVHGCGFLHRLDVPSSGLVLAATTYQAWYDLQMQLVSGSLLREYVVLCHGWVPAVRRSISVRLCYVANAVSSGHLGKPSKTRLKVVAHARLMRRAMSLTAIQILTGRKHQIRSHMAWVGHPTVHDGKYAARATALEDAQFCTRNFLHRYHLSFLDAAGAGRSAWHVLPSDLKAALRDLSPKEARSQETLWSWRGPRLQAFDAQAALKKESL